MDCEGRSSLRERGVDDGVVEGRGREVKVGEEEETDSEGECEDREKEKSDAVEL